MSTLQQQQHELELLNSNMENISHELEGLLLTNEPQCAEADLLGAASLDCYKNPSILCTQQMYWQCMQVQQQHVQSQEQIEKEFLRQQHLEHNLQQQQMEHHIQQQLQQQQVKQCTQQQLQQHQLLKENQQQYLQLQQFSETSAYFSNPGNQVSMNVEHSYVGTQSASAAATSKFEAQNSNAVKSGYSASNKYEFHYLRSQAFKKSVPNANPIPLIFSATNFGPSNSNADHRSGESRRSFVGGGAYRKHNNQKYNNKKNEIVVEDVDFDKIEINLEELGLAGEDICVKNPVLRLFRKFRLLNYYLHDVFPFGPTLNGLPTQPKPIPQTMNVQYQVKNAARNCTIFMCSKDCILNANKLLDREFYEECEKSLNIMRKLSAQLEAFKRIEFEHKRCQFVTEEAKVQAQRLELILEQLSDQVRESNLLVHVFEWSMEMKQKPASENLSLANLALASITSSSMLTQNNGQNNDDDDDDGQDGNNHNTRPEIGDSMMRLPIRYIG